MIRSCQISSSNLPFTASLRMLHRTVYLACLLPVLASGAAGQQLPACDAHVMNRHDDQITIRLQQLTALINQKLRAAGSAFSGLHLEGDGVNHLKLSGENYGNRIMISGPLKVVDGGTVKLHADKIVKNGKGEKGLMDFFGKDLADYAHFNKTQIVSADGDNLYIHPNPLLGVSGKVTKVNLRDSHLDLKFASQPCR